MESMLIGLVLDVGGREFARLLSALMVALLLGLLLVLCVPVALIAAATPLAAVPPALLPHGSAPPAILPPSSSPPAMPPRTSGPTPVVGLPAPIGTAPVEIARHYLGVPYVFGGSNPATGLDCSGLVQLVFRQVGIVLPRTAQLQYAATTRIPRDQLEAGDLVFFARTYADPHDWITHVGIYIGGGMQINAPTEGQVVSIQPVFSGFWGAHFDSGGRVRRG
jgi:cell wall-associated NlpC family hydrolase